MQYQTILDFWFKELNPKQWWVKDLGLDISIKERFGRYHLAAINNELTDWREDALGRLAEILTIDQFSRNIYRDDKRSFEFDEIALKRAQEAIEVGADQELETIQRSFMYLPFMHSESPDIHKIAEKLYSQPGLEGNLDFEHKHKVIIDRFGRYPHRNKILGRESTTEEIDFLQGPNSSF